MGIDEKNVKWQFICASGPGGQKVNKIATAAQLRFNVKKSALQTDTKERLIQISGNRINAEGELVITGRRFRTQNRNRQDALARLKHFIEIASHKPKKRKKTTIPRAMKDKRLADKRKRGEIKRQRHKLVEQ